MKYTQFHERNFRLSVDRALKTVKRILDAERHPVLAADEPHEYSDKFHLAEFCTNLAIASYMNALTALGLQPDQQKILSEWVQSKQSVTLRFIAEDTCNFLKEEDVEVSGNGDNATIVTKTEKAGLFGGTKTETVSTHVMRKVKELHWKVCIRHKIVIYPGSDIDAGILLEQRSTETVLITQAGATRGKHHAPLAEHTLHPPVDASLTWFFSKITKDQNCEFKIDREKDCKTPRRNSDVEEAFAAHTELCSWSRVTQGFFLHRIEREIQGQDNPVRRHTSTMLEPGSTGTIQGLSKEPTFNGVKVRVLEYQQREQRYKVEPVDPKSGLPPHLSIKPANIMPDQKPSTGPPLSTLSADSIFCPILPLMENGGILGISDVSRFLEEQSRSLDEALDGITRMYPAKQLVKLVSVAEASVVMLCKHMEQLSWQYSNAVDYVEDMLKQQLISAVGKEVKRKDFEQFMKFYYPKLFGPQFAPTPFSHAIRRPGCYPDGIVAIEETASSEPMETWVRSIPGESSPSIYIPINASASVEITGDRFLHGWLQHRFKTESLPDHQLACRARQFCSFLVILGTMAGPHKFEPKDAIILQNKDEVLIPLLTNVLPSAKEFKDAIQSLSPEQQEFAKAFRGMQLESSVFGVCVIQLKPQLEKLLGLPYGSLTKEIQLTQDLMSLFVDYQVPSDLLTFDGDAGLAPADKVTAVKGYVKVVMDVIDESKKRQLKEEEMKADMRGEMAYDGGEQDDEEVVGEVCLESYSAESQPSRSRIMKAGRGAGGAFLGAPRSPPMGLALSDSSAYAPQFKDQTRQVASAQMPSFEQNLSMAAVPEKRVAYSEAERSAATEHDAGLLQPKQPLSELTGSKAPGTGEDFTMIPKMLDAKLEKYDQDGAIKSTIVKAGTPWSRRRQENFLTDPKTSSLAADDIQTEKKKAFDLLDAISRSGTLAIDCSELHVVVAVSHCFENDVMGTVIRDNVNPIAKVERSSLLLASTVHAQPASVLIANELDALRLTTAFPRLFAAEEEATQEE